jgi:hypothetical protein
MTIRSYGGGRSYGMRRYFAKPPGGKVVSKKSRARRCVARLKRIQQPPLGSVEIVHETN